MTFDTNTTPEGGISLESPGYTHKREQSSLELGWIASRIKAGTLATYSSPRINITNDENK